MNSDLFKRWLQTEAEILYNQDSTPESFIKRAKPIIEALVRDAKKKKVTDKELHRVMTDAVVPEDANTTRGKFYFDIVDLCLNRAN